MLDSIIDLIYYALVTAICVAMAYVIFSISVMVAIYFGLEKYLR